MKPIGVSSMIVSRNILDHSEVQVCGKGPQGSRFVRVVAALTRDGNSRYS